MANRSAAHVRLQQWDKAEIDLSIILGNFDDYRKCAKDEGMANINVVYPFGPHTTPAKLWERRYICLRSLERNDDAKLCLDICIQVMKGD